MRAYRPRSIFSVVLLGFMVVLAPFVLAVVTAVVQVDRFAEQSRLALLNVRAATEDGRILVAQSEAMQRAFGQFDATADRDFLGIYTDRRAEYRAALDRLVALDRPDIDRARLRSLSTDEAKVFESVDSGVGAGSVAERSLSLDSLASITIRSREVLAETDRLVEERADDVTARAESLQRTLLVIAAAAVPATALLVIVFTALITRPMRALGTAIRGLGAHALDTPILVSGPRDIEALAAELESLRRRIQSLEEQKANFLRHISHELKTPLTTIREGSELLTESLGDDRREEAEIARLLRQSGLHLQRLIEDLLRFAKTQELTDSLELDPAVDLAELIAESLAALSVLIDARALGIETALAPVSACCDAGKLRTVVDNLLTNAIKYTPEGGRIFVSLSAADQDAVIDLSDSGPGVEAPDRARIFEPFWQGSARYESSVKGTGLGLSIARDYVEAHGGSIELVAGTVGAHFRIRLPLAGPEVVDGTA